MPAVGASAPGTDGQGCTPGSSRGGRCQELGQFLQASLQRHRQAAQTGALGRRKTPTRRTTGTCPSSTSALGSPRPRRNPGLPLHAVPRLRRSRATLRRSSSPSPAGRITRTAHRRPRAPQSALLVSPLPSHALCSYRRGRSPRRPGRPPPHRRDRLPQGRLPLLLFHHPQVPTGRRRRAHQPRPTGSSVRQGQRQPGPGLRRSAGLVAPAATPERR
jgi:hypothetical protein